MLVAVAGVALGGCAGAESDAEAGGAGGAGGAERTVELVVRHSRFSLDELQVRPGETVRFVIRNTDPIPHELIVGDQSVQDRHEVGTGAHDGDRPGEVSVAPNATAVTTYRFGAAGRLLFGCHLPGHWAYGMKGTISVG